MFKFFKRDGRRTSFGSSISTSAQRKFARGVDCNLKIVIRGDLNTGKTSLFYRLQAAPLPPDYAQTPEIQVANISWKYKVTDDVVKVEVWDVVDKGTPKKLPGKGEDMPEAACLDATFVDVYKGTHGAVFLYDITKPWTYEYVEREVPNVPAHIPILILANFRDKLADRKVDFAQLEYFVESLQRGKDGAPVICGESSVTDGFGLHLVNRFLNVPFLLNQRKILLAQLDTNKMESEGALQEVQLHGHGSQEQDYDAYMERKREREEARQNQAAADSLQVSQQASGANSRQNSGPPSPGIAAEAGKGSRFGRFSVSLKAKLQSLKDGNSGGPTSPTSSGPSIDVSRKTSRSSSVNAADVYDFKPDEDLDDSFFGESTAPTLGTTTPANAFGSDDDDDDGDNPMVTADADLDEDELELDVVAADDSELSDLDEVPSGAGLVAADTSDISDFDVSDNDSDDEPPTAPVEKKPEPVPAKPASPPPKEDTKPAKAKTAPSKPKSALDSFLDDDDDDDIGSNPLVAGNIGDDSDDSDDSSVKPQVDADGYDPLAVDFDFDVSESRPPEHIMIDDGSEATKKKKKKKKKSSEGDNGDDDAVEKKKKKKKKHSSETDEGGHKHKKKKKKQKSESTSEYDAI